jgi:hypothetical protein
MSGGATVATKFLQPDDMFVLSVAVEYSGELSSVELRQGSRPFGPLPTAFSGLLARVFLRKTSRFSVSAESALG